MPRMLVRGGWKEWVKALRWVRRVRRMWVVCVMLLCLKKCGDEADVPEWGSRFCLPGAAWRSGNPFARG